MRVWRITSRKYAASPLDGEGARRRGGRWNPRGRPMVYASESPALATLEALVYVGNLDDLAALGFVLLPLDVPDDAIEALDESTLPEDWRRYPYPPETQAMGEAWAASRRSLALHVPSACVMGKNLLLNPEHPDLARVKVGAPVEDAWRTEARRSA